MTAEFPFDVFLSHNQADQPRVRQLAERLRAARSQHSTLNHQPTPGLKRSIVLFRAHHHGFRRGG